MRAAGAVWGWPGWLRLVAVVAMCGCDAGVIAGRGLAVGGAVAVALWIVVFSGSLRDDRRRGP